MSPEEPAKRAETFKAQRQTDIGHRAIAVTQEVPCVLHAAGSDVLVWCLVKELSEHAEQVIRR